MPCKNKASKNSGGLFSRLQCTVIFFSMSTLPKSLAKTAQLCSWHHVTVKLPCTKQQQKYPCQTFSHCIEQVLSRPHWSSYCMDII